MSKLLNARDLLELVRTGEVEGRDESETIVSSATSDAGSTEEHSAARRRVRPPHAAATRGLATILS
jgi:hypothetical protein